MSENNVVRLLSRDERVDEENVAACMEVLGCLEAFIQNDEIKHVAVVGIGPNNKWFFGVSAHGFANRLALIGTLDVVKSKMVGEIEFDPIDTGSAA